MYIIKRILIWLRRSPHSRGLGIQSPSAYRFVRYVVSEHYHYYAYKDLLPMSRQAGKRRLKLCRFYFRLANHMQPRTIIDYMPHTDAYRLYMQTGCRTARIITLDDEGAKHAEALPETVDMARVSLRGDYEGVIDTLMNRITTESVMVVEHIYKNRETQAVWKRLTDDPRTGVSFDLYYCGVLFFDTRIYKQSYVINF